jgi:hypothetical protein
MFCMPTTWQAHADRTYTKEELTIYRQWSPDDR